MKIGGNKASLEKMSGDDIRTRDFSPYEGQDTEPEEVPLTAGSVLDRHQTLMRSTVLVRSEFLHFSSAITRTREYTLWIRLRHRERSSVFFIVVCRTRLASVVRLDTGSISTGTCHQLRVARFETLIPSPG